MSNLQFPNTNVSLVAFYGDKPPQLKSLIRQLQDSLANIKSIADKFVPYQLEQVHGTIIGCEGCKSELGIIDRWFSDRRQEIRYIDLAGVVDYLQHRIDLPLTIRFSGYDRKREYNFRSRNQHLYCRSFQLQKAGDKVIPISIGWSWKNNGITMAIDNLRHSFEQFNLLHKYHATPEAIDNDFYLRLGTIDGELSTVKLEAIANETRNFLAQKSPLYIPLTKADLAFAQYRDLSLTPSKTTIVPISDITVERLKRMYPD